MNDITLTKEEKQYKRLTEEPVARLILELGLPTTISMLITNLYNMVDTWFVSQLGTSATGAVGVVFGLMAIIQAFGFMFGHGAGSNISRLLGAHKKGRAKAFSATGFYLAVGAGVLIAVIGIADLNGLCRLLGSTETILPYARIYAFYILLSAPAMASGCVMNNVLRYEGYANLAMVGLVSGGILNMAGDAILMWGLNLGIRGAALSTMISQYISFGILLFFFLRGKTQSSLAPKYFTWELAVHKNILTAGFPSMMRQGLASVSTMVLNAQAAVYGDIAIAAMSVVSRIFNFVFSVALGIGQGFQPVSSFNYGAKKYSRVRKAFWFTLCASLVTMAVFAGVVYVFRRELLLEFLTDMEVYVFRRELLLEFLTDMDAYEIAFYALQIQCLTLPFIPVCICGNMLFQSIGKGGRATILASFRSGTIYIPALLILTTLWGIRGIQWSQPVSDVLSAVFSLPVAMVFLKRLPEDGAEV